MQFMPPCSRRGRKGTAQQSARHASMATYIHNCYQAHPWFYIQAAGNKVEKPSHYNWPSRVMPRPTNALTSMQHEGERGGEVRRTGASLIQCLFYFGMNKQWAPCHGSALIILSDISCLGSSDLRVVFSILLPVKNLVGRCLQNCSWHILEGIHVKNLALHMASVWVHVFNYCLLKWSSYRLIHQAHQVHQPGFGDSCGGQRQSGLGSSRRGAAAPCPGAYLRSSPVETRMAF